MNQRHTSPWACAPILWSLLCFFTVSGTQADERFEVDGEEVLLPPSQDRIADGLVLHLPFEGNTQDVQNNNHAQAANAPTYVAGQVGRAISLAAATNQYVYYAPTPSDLLLGTSSFTLSVWVNSTDSTSDAPLISNKAWSSGTNPGYILSLYRGRWKVNFTAQGALRSDVVVDDNASLISDGRWHHLVAVFNRSNFTMSLYQDGVNVINGTINGSGSIDNALNKTGIGQDGTLNYSPRFGGRLDEVMIWRRVLAASEVKDLFAANSDGVFHDITIQTNLITHLTFDGNANDTSPAALPTTVGGTVAFTSGQMGKAALFTGVAGQYVSLRTPTQLNFGGSTDFTVSLWVKAPPGQNDPVLMSNKNWASGSNTGWVMSLFASNTWKWNFKGKALGRFDASLGQIQDNLWHHVAVTHRRGELATFYQDGRLVGTAVNIAGSGSVDSGLPTVIGNDGTLGYSPRLNAAIDDVGIWSRALSTQEMTKIYTSGRTGRSFTEKRRRALIFGIDGCRGDAFHAQVSRVNGNFRAFTNIGKWAPCSQPNDSSCAFAHDGPVGRGFWVTAPGWLSVVTGANNSTHRVSSNGCETQAAYFNISRASHPTLFKRARDQGMRTAAAGVATFLSSGPPATQTGILDYECGTLDANSCSTTLPGTTSTCNLDYRLATAYTSRRDARTTQFMRSRILDPTSEIVMGVLDEVDSAGHGNAFDPNNIPYMTAINLADTRLGQVLSDLSYVTQRRNEEWIVLITSDHGGTNNGHSSTSPTDKVVPFAVGLYGSNLTLQPLTTNSNHPRVRQMDVAPTVLYWLKLIQARSVDEGIVQGLP